MIESLYALPVPARSRMKAREFLFIAQAAHSMIRGLAPCDSLFPSRRQPWGNAMPEFSAGHKGSVLAIHGEQMCHHLSCHD